MAASNNDYVLPYPLASTEWLQNNMERVRIIDGSWHLPVSGRVGTKEFMQSRIPGAIFFDIDEISDKTTLLPHMLPTESEFGAHMDRLGITKNDAVVVYDKAGLFSAARVWWTFKIFGHEAVTVLDGGFPAWESEGRPVDSSPRESTAPLTVSTTTGYVATKNAALVRSRAQVLEVANGSTPHTVVVDARPKGRFDGVDPEPRPGLVSGHMPNSVNLPIAALLNQGKLLKREEVYEKFKAAGADLQNTAVVASCGSGVMGAVLCLALETMDNHSWSLYDGSWAEYGDPAFGNPIIKADK